MATVQLSDPGAIDDLSSLLARVRRGEEIVFKDGDATVAVMHAPLPPRRTIEECMALLPPDSPPVDDDFAKDVEAAIAWRREPLNGSAWD
jgi:antitoxin (DNA-binding transcriptional repressor) of toxin-antitoxin stability system